MLSPICGEMINPGRPRLASYSSNCIGERWFIYRSMRAPGNVSHCRPVPPRPAPGPRTRNTDAARPARSPDRTVAPVCVLRLAREGADLLAVASIWLAAAGRITRQTPKVGAGDAPTWVPAAGAGDDLRLTRLTTFGAVTGGPAKANLAHAVFTPGCTCKATLFNTRPPDFAARLPESARPAPAAFRPLRSQPGPSLVY